MASGGSCMVSKLGRANDEVRPWGQSGLGEEQLLENSKNVKIMLA